MTVNRDKFLTINQLDALISQIYFGRKLGMFRTVPLSEICGVSFENKFEELLHLVYFIIRKTL